VRSATSCVARGQPSQATQDREPTSAFLDVTVVSGTVGVKASCNTLPSACATTTTSVAIVLGVDVFLSVEGDAGSTVRFALSEAAPLENGAVCTVVPSLQFPSGVDRCDVAAGAYCAGNTGCTVAAPLVFDTPVEVVSVAGVISETCYAFSGAGSYSFVTEGACALAGVGNDPAVRVMSGGHQFARNDDGANRCALLDVDLTDGAYFVCVGHYALNGVVAGVTFTATRR
jgi:hypothetical protein